MKRDHSDLPLVEILMATYNGEKFIEEQLNSILSQSYTNWKLIIRDDNSTDNTQKIINKYIRLYPDKIFLIKNDIKRIGACQNFSKLLEYSQAKYIMFSDQDDIWFNNKIEVSLNKIRELEKNYGEHTPILIHTDSKVVDENCNIIAESFWKYQNINPKATQFNRLLIQNVVTGCTMIINKSLKNKTLPISKKAIMYDWWIALVASCFGVIEILDFPTLYYRQHSSNTIGAKNYNLNYIIYKLTHKKQITNSINACIKQAITFYNYFNKTNYNLKAAYILGNIKNYNWFIRKKLLIQHKILKQGTVRNLGFLLFC